MMFTACSAPRPLEQQSVHDAAAALGGAERLQSIKTLVVEGEGTQYNLGQDVVPGASGQTYAVTQYKRAIDVAADRARTELVRVPKFTYWQGLAPQRQVQGIDKEIGYNVSAAGTASRIAASAAQDRRVELLRHPITAVRAALDPSARLTNTRTEGGESLVDVRTTDGREFTLAVDVSHVYLQRMQGAMTDATWHRLRDYGRIAEVHVAANQGRADSHQPLSAQTFGLDWARERVRDQPVILECYMHRLSDDRRRQQLELLQ